MFDGVQLVCRRVAALAWKLSLGVVGTRAARDVNVATTEMSASFQGGRGRRNTVYDNARREKVCVLKVMKERTNGTSTL